MLESKKLLSLSKEINIVSPFAKGLYQNKKNDQAIQYLICLDFLMKGVLIHW